MVSLHFGWRSGELITTLLRPIVFEHISGLLTTSEQYSVLLVERAVVGLLRLCLIVAQFVRFHLIAPN